MFAGTGGSASSRASRYAVIFEYGRVYGTPSAPSTSGAWLFPSPSRNRGPNRASRLARLRATSAGSCIHIFSTPVANGIRRVAASRCSTAPNTSPPASGMKMALVPELLQFGRCGGPRARVGVIPELTAPDPDPAQVNGHVCRSFVSWAGPRRHRP
jgi:hypothetical protein